MSASGFKGAMVRLSCGPSEPLPLSWAARARRLASSAALECCKQRSRAAAAAAPERPAAALTDPPTSLARPPALCRPSSMVSLRLCDCGIVAKRQLWLGPGRREMGVPRPPARLHPARPPRLAAACLPPQTSSGRR